MKRQYRNILCSFLVLSLTLIIGACSNQSSEEVEVDDRLYSPYLIIDSSLEGIVFSQLDKEDLVLIDQPIFKAEVEDQLRNQVWEIIAYYLKVKDNLYKENYEALEESLDGLDERLEPKYFEELEEEERLLWERAFSNLNTTANRVYTDSQFSQKDFAHLSDDLILFLLEVPIVIPTLYIHFCPVSNEGEGANWLSDKELVENPYMGKSGEGCGILMGALNKRTQDKFQIYKRK